MGCGKKKPVKYKAKGTSMKKVSTKKRKAKKRKK